MTGNGILIALLKFGCRHKPEDIQVTLNLRTTISSLTIPLPKSNPDSVASPNDTYIRIHASIKHSLQPTLPVTLSTWRTPLERPFSPEEPPSLAVWFNSAITYLRSTTNPKRYSGPPELGYKIHRRGGFARNLREDWEFITIPSFESGQDVLVEQRLPLEKLQFWETRDDGYRNEVKSEKGEKWLIGPTEGGLGTFWWRWGELEGDLKGKEFRNDEWHDGENNNREGEGEKWVESEGENGFGLTMEIENQAEVEFV